jgi:hypothetical protein
MHSVFLGSRVYHRTSRPTRGLSQIRPLNNYTNFLSGYNIKCLYMWVATFRRELLPPPANLLRASSVRRRSFARVLTSDVLATSNPLFSLWSLRHQIYAPGSKRTLTITRTNKPTLMVLILQTVPSRTCLPQYRNCFSLSLLFR